MGKASIIVHVTVAVLLLLFLSYSPKKHSNHLITTPTIEDKQWEKQYHEHSHPELAAHDSAPGEESLPRREDFMDAEDYLNDEKKFNFTNWLVLLFRKIDVDPADGFVSEHELTEWNLQQGQREVLHRTQTEIGLHDKNCDGFVSFAEYDPPRNADNDSFGHHMGWWKEEHFNASDANGDGLLNLTEFNDFLHPADSKNPKLLQWLCKEEVSYLIENDTMDAPARVSFAQLDKDGNGYLSDAELLPIIGKIHPSKHYYSKQEADYIISLVDTDKDGCLTLTEMIKNPHVFYSPIFNDDKYEYDYHDEFR